MSIEILQFAEKAAENKFGMGNITTVRICREPEVFETFLRATDSRQFTMGMNARRPPECPEFAPERPRGRQADRVRFCDTKESLRMETLAEVLKL